MPVDFVGREVEVTLSEGEAPAPVAFRLGRREYKVAEQIASWQDHAFGSLQHGRNRPQQQQRQYYRVRTEEGEVYELYADWSPGRRRKAGARGTRWYLHRRLSPAAAEEQPEEEGETESAGE